MSALYIFHFYLYLGAMTQVALDARRFHQRKRAALHSIYAEEQLNALLAAPLQGSAPSDNAAKKDRSLKAQIDVGAREFCDCINAHAELYTTSSCSGRFQLYVDCVSMSTRDVSTKHNGFISFAAHSAAELPDTEAVCALLADPAPFYARANLTQFRKTQHATAGRLQCSLIFEPFIFHVKAASFDAALLVLAACQAAGVQDCGITGFSPSRGYQLSLHGSHRMVVPLFAADGSPLANAATVKAYLELAALYMQKNEAKLAKLTKALKRSEAPSGEPSTA